MIKSDLGAVTAYADAVAHGYTGTREDFGKLLAGAGQNLADAAAAKDAAEAAADNAGSAAQTATDAAGTAGQAAGAAGQAAGAATNAAGAASTSAGAAAQSAEAAETAQQGAENAAKKAVEAKTGAENALKDADTAKDAASGYADAATESATAAAASATNAAGSAKIASDAAQKIEDSAGKIDQNAEAVSQLKEDTAALQKRQNVLVGTETGNQISVDDAFSAPLCGLTVYGKSTQDATPTPDAPVPIVSAGDGGTIAVTLSDGNGKTQTLTLPTPTGLPGIHVTSGGNYTDQTGQQWVCDEVDLERGVRVQRVNKVEVDGETVKFVQTGNYANITLRDLPIALYNIGQKIFATSTFTELSWFYNMVNGQFLYLIAPDMSDKINVSCKKQLGKIYYALATPIETPLTPAEIAAYKALTAYAPDTVVQASDGAGIKLDYQRDVNLVIKNLEDAIASMTTT